MQKEDIANALKTSAICRYNGSEYRVYAFYLYADKITHRLKYSAVLLDKNGNSTITVPIERVELKGEHHDKV